MENQELFDPNPRPKIKKNILPENPDSDTDDGASSLGRFPKWLHHKLPKGKQIFETNKILKKHNLSTVCEEAKCPNRIECYSKKTATFLALGDACTRACGFCDIDFTKTPIAPDENEPEHIAKVSKELGLKHVVITMVARDDLKDKGALHIAKIIQSVRNEIPNVTVEVLTSDFMGDLEALDIVLNEGVEVFNHNIETVERLTPKVRHQATYNRTLKVLSHAKQSNTCNFVKSGIMVGLGETKEEVFTTLDDLKTAGCDIVTIGHYLQASRVKLRVKKFITPEEFKEYEEYGEKIGLSHVYAGPFVRSSYNADLIKDLATKKQQTPIASV